MADIVSREVRSRMMSRIRRRDTHPEMTVRKGLHGMGFRYRVDVAALPGRPDIVLPRYRAAIFVNGCFWHGHDCVLYREPKTETARWKAKIEGNRTRDHAAVQALLVRGWRVLIVWECALKGRARFPIEEVLERCATWLRGEAAALEIRGAF